MTVFKDSYGWYWAGTAIVKKGLFYQKPGARDPTTLYQISQEPLDHTDIRDFYEDDNGILWVATNGAGIFSLKPENRDSINFVKFNEDGLAPQLLNTLTIYAEPTGVIWFGGFFMILTPGEF